MRRIPIAVIGDGEHDFYLCFCETPHGKKYWRVTGDWETQDNVSYIIRVDADDEDAAMEFAQEYYNLKAWEIAGLIYNEFTDEYYEGEEVTP